MKAIIEGDTIVKWSMDNGIEVGNPPKENGHIISRDRLRWNGSELVDISTVTSAAGLYVEYGTFKLHVVPFNNTQHVNMTFADRKRLRNANGKIRLKTPRELQIDRDIKYARLRRAEYPPLTTQMGELMKFIADKFYDDPLMAPTLRAVLRDIDVVKEKFPAPAEGVIPSAARVPLNRPH